MSQATESLFSPDRLAHANLFVRNVDQSASFYRNVCGINEVFREPDISACFLSNGATHHDIALMQVSDKPLIGKDGKVQNSMARGSRPGLNHLAFHVSSEAALIEAYQNAAKLGVKLEKALDHGMSRSIYLFDPDGNAVEFYVDTVDDWRQFYINNRDQLITTTWDPANTKRGPVVKESARSYSHVEGAPLYPRELCGATLVTANLGLLSRFYREVAGLRTLVGDEASVQLFSLPSQDRACLALVQAEPGEAVGLHSLWFLISPDSPVIDDPAVERGITVEGSSSSARCFTRDPNGFELAFYADPDMLPREAKRLEVMSAKRSAH